MRPKRAEDRATLVGLINARLGRPETAGSAASLKVLIADLVGGGWDY
jgi:hypothetical protein